MVDKRIFREYGRLGILLFVTSFLLNFFWESIHAAFLYTCCVFPPVKYVSIMSYASTVDGLLIVGMFTIVAIFVKNGKWLQKLDSRNISLFVGTGIIIAAIIEYHAIFIADKWSYSSMMPTLFGIGLSPLVQLSVTGLLAVWFVKKVLHK